MAPELIETMTPVHRKLGVVEVFVNEYLDHRQGQSAVRAGTDRDPFGIGSIGGLGASRVDHDDLCTPLRRSFETVHVERRRIGGRVGAPDDQQLSVFHIGIHVDEHASERQMRREHGERYVAESPHSHGVRRTEWKEHVRCRRNGHTLGLKHVTKRQLESPAAGIDGDRLRPVLGLDSIEGSNDRVVSLVPGDSLELECTLITFSSHGVAQSVL